MWRIELAPFPMPADSALDAYLDRIHPTWREANIFPIISEGALRATLGILDRTVRRRSA